MTGKKQIFIGGYMHSGTTLLYSLLKNNNAVFGYRGETRLFERYSEFEKELASCSAAQDFEKFLSSFSNGLTLSDEDTSFVRSQNFSVTRPSIAGLFQEISESLCDHHQKIAWVEKTPTNVYFVDDIVSKFPESKIVLIYRDFRDILASKKTRTLTVESGRYEQHQVAQKKLEKDWNVIADAVSWNKSIDAQQNAILRYPGQVLLIKYESLVEDPSKEFQKICSFVGIKFDVSDLETNFSNRALPQGASQKGVYASAVATWPTVLSQQEASIASYLTRNRLTRCGYDFKDDTSPLTLLAMVTYVPGVLRRVYKRFRLLGLAKGIQFAKNYLRRFTIFSR